MEHLDNIKSMIKVLNGILLSITLIAVLMHMIPNMQNGNLFSINADLSKVVLSGRVGTTLSGEVNLDGSVGVEQPYSGFHVALSNFVVGTPLKIHQADIWGN